MTKLEAITKAIDAARTTNLRQSLWLTGPEQYTTDMYKPSDEKHFGYLGVVWPDGGIDYCRNSADAKAVVKQTN